MSTLMILLYKLSVNFTMFVFLSIVSYTAKLRLDRRDRLNQLFLSACALVLATLVLESLGPVLNGWLYPGSKWIFQVLLAVLYSMPPVVSYYWLLFTKALTGGGSGMLCDLRSVCIIPAAVGCAFSFLSIPFGFMFSVGEGSVYHRGPLFGLHMLITTVYTGINIATLIKRRNRLLKEEVRSLSLICIVPVVGGLLQALMQGMLLMWGFTAGSLIVLYVYLQERMIQVDGLTGAWTRRSLNQHFSRMVGKCAGEPLGVLFLDIDDFKSVNDQYGHAEGDAALKAFVATIQAQLRQGDILARVGGDEFVIIAPVNTPDGLRAIEHKIEEALKDYNGISGKPYRLRCSVGSVLHNVACDMDAALVDVDRLMYEVKQRKRGGTHQERRETQGR